ncbi:MAG: L-lactate permease [Bacteroidota bacterium]
MLSTYYPLWSFLPILALLVISLWKGVKPAVYIGLILTTLIFFLSGNGLPPFLASLISALVSTLNILMIIFGALLLYDAMAQKGYIQGIQDSLSRIHPRKEVRFWFLALFLTAFFESVAGFGTPGAIVPLLLISLGFSPVLSIAAVLLINGLFAVSGAVGIPVIAGLEIPLGLDAAEITTIYGWAAGAMLVGGMVIAWFVHRYVRQESEGPLGWEGWTMFAAIMIPYACLGSFLHEMTGIVSAILMASVAYLFIFQERRLSLLAWTPYGLLVGLLLLPKLIPPLGQVLTLTLSFEGLFGTDIEAGFQPLRSPLIPFVVATLFALYRAKDFSLSLKLVGSKTLAVFVILFPSLAITQLMLNGSGELPSMIEALASVFREAGGAYPLFSPLIGVIGAFMTGSTTVSNIIFGPVQFNTAQALSLDSSLILGLQLAGGSLGNAVCLFNIIAAATVAGVRDFRAILQKNLLPVFLAALGVAGVGFVGIWIGG